MDRRILATALACLLVATAGCSFLGGDATPTAEPANGDDSTSTATATPTPTATPVSFDFPDGYDTSGVTDGQAAADTHRSAVRSLDSYTVDYEATVNTSSEVVVVDYVQLTNVAEQRALVQSNVSSAEQVYGGTTQFYTADAVYVRSQYPDNTTEYDNATQQFNASALTGSEFVTPLLTDVSYGEASLVDRDGETWARYEATSLDAASRVLGQGVSTENVTSFSATVFVDADGVVRRIEYEATVQRDGATREVAATVTVSDLDGTSVPRPDWVDRA
jgi:hypothetical protein